MVNVGLNTAYLLGILLILLGLSIIPLGLRLRQQSRFENLTQDVVLTLVYLLSGLILFFHGWRLDPILQFIQILLVGSTFYLVLKDMRDRS